MPDRQEIALKVKNLRKGRGVSQGELARLLRVSQSWLSEIEAGKGSFSADELIFILKYFNVPLSHFEAAPVAAGDAIQKALAHYGAAHLVEDRAVLPSERLEGLGAVIREALLDAGSARWLTALAPVLVRNIDQVNLQKLHAQFQDYGLQNRFLWLLDNVAEAVRETLDEGVPRKESIALQRALTALEGFRVWTQPPPGEAAEGPEDTLGPGLLALESGNEIRERASKLSRAWKILTPIQVEDFKSALRESHGLGNTNRIVPPGS